MSGLKVLLAGRIENLPSSLSWPKNLRSLFLVKYQLDILPNEIGELVNLEILSLSNSKIVMLQKEIGGLKHLRLLDLTKCKRLKTIPPGLISGLVQLEELYMMQFKYWKGVEDTNASIAEVASLTNLTSLQLQADIRCINLLQDSENLGKLTRYHVIINKDYGDDYANFDRCIQLSHFELHPLTDLVHVLFENAQAIKLEGRGSTETTNKLSRHGYKSAERLVLSNQDLEFLFDSNSWNLPNTSFLPRLTTLVLRSNDALKEICHGQPPTRSFSNLASIRLEGCNGLQNLFSFSVASMLSKLEFLSIKSCSFIETVFSKQNGQYGNSDLCKATDQIAIEFPQLYEMKIESCPMLKSFCNIESSSLPENDHNAERQFFFNQKVMCSSLKIISLKNFSFKIGIFDPRIPNDKFIGLERLSVSKCSGWVNLFSNSISRVIPNLRDLSMDDMEMLQEVIAKDEEEKTNSKVVLLPQLKKLRLWSLPKMQQFCHISHGVELPSLEVLRIRSCGLMETFSRNGFNPAFESNFADQSFFDEVTCNKLKTLQLSQVGVIELFNHKISIDDFSGLETVDIFDCERLISIFSPGMVRGLVNLQSLKVQKCSELQELISKDDKEGDTNTTKDTIFPRLKRLELHKLPKLIRFCHFKNDLAIPSLEGIEIRYCRLMETFSQGSVHLPSLQWIAAKDLGSVEGELSKEKFESQFLNNKQVMNNEGTATVASTS